MVEDDLAVLAERSGWTGVGDLAIFCPVPSGWYARVARLQRPARDVDKFHIALISPAEPRCAYVLVTQRRPREAPAKPRPDFAEATSEVVQLVTTHRPADNASE